MKIIKNIDEAIESVKNWNLEEREYKNEQLNSLLKEIEPAFIELVEKYPLPWNNLGDKKMSEMNDYTNEIVRKYFHDCSKLKNIQVFMLAISECLDREQNAQMYHLN